MSGLIVDEGKCTDCRICQLVCSALYAGCYSPKLSRIMKGAGILPDTTYTHVCRQCSDAPCVAACPTEALIQPGGEGVVKLEDELCTGCGVCVDECPYDAIWVNENNDLAYKCHLCESDPQCLKRCPTGAISLEGEGV